MNTLNLSVSEKKEFYQSLSGLARTNVYKALGISALVQLNSSAKMEHTYKNKKALEFLLYLQPVQLDNFVTCPMCEHCKQNCLVGSGRDKMYAKRKENPLRRAKRIRTELFYYNRDLFMRILCAEIDKAITRADKLGLKLIVRLNGTSDISPLSFRANGKNILEMYPNLQFVEYTKVVKYLDLMDRYPNLDYTFSYDGYNDDAFRVAITKTRVAVVFHKELPKLFCGIPVINGDESDMRCEEPKNVIVGLHYKPTANSDISSKFIIKQDDKRISC